MSRYDAISVMIGSTCPLLLDVYERLISQPDKDSRVVIDYAYVWAPCLQAEEYGHIATVTTAVTAFRPQMANLAIEEVIKPWQSESQVGTGGMYLYGAALGIFEAGAHLNTGLRDSMAFNEIFPRAISTLITYLSGSSTFHQHTAWPDSQYGNRLGNAIKACVRGSAHSFRARALPTLVEKLATAKNAEFAYTKLGIEIVEQLGWAAYGILSQEERISMLNRFYKNQSELEG